MNATPRDKEDILINYRDLLLYVLLKWRQILIGTLVLAILLTGGMYLLNSLSYQKEDAAASALSADDLAQAQLVIDTKKNVDRMKDYNANALMMQIRSRETPTATATYFVTGERSFITASLYQKYLGEQELLNKIAEMLSADGKPVDVANLRDLVTATVEYDESAAETADRVLLAVKVIAPEEELCKRIDACVKDYVTALQATVTETAGAHTCALVTEGYRVCLDDTLQKAQDTNRATQENMKKNYETWSNALSSTQTLYVRRTLAAERGESTDFRPGINKKVAVLGFAGGLVIFILLYAFLYIVDRKLKSAADLIERYGMYLYGTLPAQPKKNAIDRGIVAWLRKPADADSAAALIGQQMLLTAQALGKDAPSLCVTGSTVAEVEGIRKPLQEMLTQNGVKVTLTACPLDNAEALSAVADADTVILTEKAGVARYNDIYREIGLCDRLQKPLLGAIVIE